MDITIREHSSPCKTVDLVDGEYVIAYNVRRDYAERIAELERQLAETRELVKTFDKDRKKAENAMAECAKLGLEERKQLAEARDTIRKRDVEIRQLRGGTDKV